MTTYNDMLVQGMDFLGETLGDPAAGNPFAWYRNIPQCIAEVQRLTQIYYQVGVPVQLVANQAVYAASSLQVVQTVQAWNASGLRTTLGTSSIATMDDRVAGWRSTGSDIQVKLWIPAGMNSVILWPAPNWSSLLYTYADLAMHASNPLMVTSAARPFIAADVNMTIIFTASGAWTGGSFTIQSVAGGYATLLLSPAPIGTTGGQGLLSSGGMVMEGFGTVPLTWGPALVSPLPDRANMGAVLKACMLRIMQNPTPTNQTRASFIASQIREQMNELETEAITLSNATRQPSYVDGSGATYSGSDGNPLDF